MKKAKLTLKVNFYIDIDENSPTSIDAISKAKESILFRSKEAISAHFPHTKHDTPSVEFKTITP